MDAINGLLDSRHAACMCALARSQLKPEYYVHILYQTCITGMCMHHRFVAVVTIHICIFEDRHDTDVICIIISLIHKVACNKL